MTTPLASRRSVPPLPGAVPVLLAGLPPVYAHGLSPALRAAGFSCTVLPGPPALPVVPGPAVVVAPAALAPLLRLPDGVPAPFALVLLLQSDRPQAYVDGLRAGAVGLLSPHTEPDESVAVVQLAVCGTTALPQRVALALLPPVSGPAPALSPSERSWLRRLARHATVAQLARSAGYSEREMYRLLARLYARLGTSSRTEALLRAQQWRLLDDED